jgi:nucleoside-diphosphate-sugar epimerase
MDKNAKIYIAGHLGMVGSAIKRNLEANDSVSPRKWAVSLSLAVMRHSKKEKRQICLLRNL